MHVDHHPIINEFPEFRDTIHDLKQKDSHFARLLEKYEQIDKDIVRAENGVDHLGDFSLETLKKERLGLKDELYKALKAA